MPYIMKSLFLCLCLTFSCYNCTNSVSQQNNDTDLTGEWDGDGNGDSDSNTDDSNTDDSNTDDSNTDDSNTDDSNTDDSNTDDSNTDDSNTDNNGQDANTDSNTDSSSLATWAPPQDASGWSILTPSADSRIMYVSESTGNDGTGQIYSISQIGSDPRNPSIAIQAYATIPEAMAQIRDGYPDWVLLRRGDTWEDTSINVRHIGSGRSASEMAVVTYYGASGDRPMIINSTFTVGHGTDSHKSNWAFVGLSFYGRVHDPDAADFDVTADHSFNLNFMAGGSNILVEDCKLRFIELVVQEVDGPWENVTIRRNIISDNYFVDSCDDQSVRPSAAFISGVTNYLIEENMVDHTGWSEEFSNSGRNMYNHGWYLQYTNSGTLIFRGNIMSRVSANAVQNRSGGVVEYNLAIQAPAGLAVMRDTSHGAGCTAGLTSVKYNVILEGLWMGDCPNSSGANWGLGLDDNLETGTIIEENIVAHNLDKLGSVEGIHQHAHLNYINNIVYDWVDSEDMWNSSWPDPEQSIGSYNQSIRGQTNSTEAFIHDALNRPIGEWPDDLSAYAVINYIRQGFGL